jgi:hypothetical protein
MRLPKQDHYERARDAAARRLKDGLDADRLARLGAELSADGRVVTLPSLCWRFEVRLDPFAVLLLPGRQEVSSVWQVLVPDYLNARAPAPPRTFLSFADFPEGRGYESAFEGRVNQRLSRGAGRERATLLQAARRLGAVPTEGDPIRCMFRFFPLLEVQVVCYAGEEDLPPSCSVLLPDNLLTLFSMEDGIVAAERLVAALEGKTPAARKPG